jgi:poly(A)-specific ribonuclease
LAEFGDIIVVVRAQFPSHTSLLTSSAVSFLHDNGFRFDLPITHGVPYLSRKEEVEARINMRDADTINAALPNMPSKKEDLPLLAHIREVITKWQSKPKDQQDEYLNIPYEANDPAVPQTLDRYQIRLTHQTVRIEFPGLKTHGMGHFVQITNPTSEQLESQQSILERQREREISKAIGFRWLMEAIMGGDISNMPEEYFMTGEAVDGKISTAPTEDDLPKLQEKLKARRKIIVGHNCFTDLVNLYKCFIGTLPEKLEDFQENVHGLFPAIIDTKHIASFGGKAYGDTSLTNVYANTNKEPFPRIEVDTAFDRYDYVESYHEAGYDSLQTAKILIKLSSQMERDNKLKDEKTNAESVGHEFGIGEGYVTAPESQSDGSQQAESLTQTISNVVTSPVTAMKNLLLSNSSPSAEPKSAGMFSNEAQAGSVVSSSESSSEAASPVVAVKQSQSWSNSSTKVERVKSKFSSNSIYDVLEAEEAESDEENNLLMWSDDEERKKNKKEKKRLKKLAQQDRMESMIQKGELMPRWDGAKGFWRFFGNKLQVNGTVEGVCHLP